VIRLVLFFFESARQICKRLRKIFQLLIRIDPLLIRFWFDFGSIAMLE